MALISGNGKSALKQAITVLMKISFAFTALKRHIKSDTIQLDGGGGGGLEAGLVITCIF